MNNYNTEKGLLQAISSNLSENERLVLDFLLYYKHKFPQVFISQTLIARSIAVARETANRIIKRLVDKKFIVKKKRFNTTSLYFVNPVFFKFQHNKEIKKILPALKKWSLCTLLAFFSTTITSSPHYYINNTSCTDRESIYRGVKSSQFYNSKKLSSNKIKNGEKVDDIVISPLMIRITKLLCLSKWGQIKLFVIPEAALSHALSHYVKSRDIKNSFSWFFVRSRDYCKHNGLAIDWNLFYILKKRYNMPENPRYTLSVEVSKPAAVTKFIEIKDSAPIDYIAESNKWEKAYAEGKMDKWEKVFNQKAINPFLCHINKEIKPIESKPVKSNSYFMKFIPIHAQ